MNCVPCLSATVSASAFVIAVNSGDAPFLSGTALPAARYDGITRFLTAVSVQLAEAEAVLNTRMLSPDSCKILSVA